MIFTSLIIPAVLSSICTIILILVWILNPKWRSLHNYISINQIVMGSLHLISMNLMDIFENDLYTNSGGVFALLNGYLYLSSMCWSLCATLLAYLRLVLVYTGKISFGKRKATTFSFGTLFAIKGISDFMVPFVYNLEGFFDLFLSRVTSVYMLTIVNLFLFVKVVVAVMPWGKRVAIQKKGKRVSALVGVAVLCDIITSIDFLNVILPDPFEIISHLFNFRLIPHTIIVLFSRTSSDYWKKLVKQRRRRMLNII